MPNGCEEEKATFARQKNSRTRIETDSGLVQSVENVGRGKGRATTHDSAKSRHFKFYAAGSEELEGRPRDATINKRKGSGRAVDG